MSYLFGKNALAAYTSSSLSQRKKILTNLGSFIRRIHVLKIPSQWVHHKHEVKDAQEWITWTKNRIKKYLTFAQHNLKPQYGLFLREKFKKFFSFLKNDLKFVQLHWDYHLDNILVDSQGNISGLLDFDNAMKGHDLAELGQTKYWLRFRLKDYQSFEYFFKGYGGEATERVKILINGYCLLHLVAVTRSIWPKRRKYNWIVKEHEKMLDEMMEMKEA